jgi:hypothetical protein
VIPNCPLKHLENVVYAPGAGSGSAGHATLGKLHRMDWVITPWPSMPWHSVRFGLTQFPKRSRIPSVGAQAEKKTKLKEKQNKFLAFEFQFF